VLRKLISLSLIGLTLVSLIAAIVFFAQARHARYQAQKMHALAVQHRAYKRKSIWTHDERAYVRLDLSRRDTAAQYLVIAGLLGGTSLVMLILRKRRHYKRHQKPLSYASSDRPTSRSLTVGTCMPLYVERPVSTSASSPRKTEREFLDEIGKRGEDQLVLLLQPLLDAGWRILGRNIDVVTEAGGKFGDIDVLLVSPKGLGFTIDAKNGTQRVWYDSKTDEVVFDRGWTPKYRRAPIARRYSINNAEYIASWAERNFSLRKAIPIMACTDSVNLRLQKTVRTFCLLRFDGLLEKLRALNVDFDQPNARRKV
jgi:hypothetical protein